MTDVTSSGMLVPIATTNIPITTGDSPDSSANFEPWEIVILIELKSKREDVHRKMREYMCYASLLRDVPVWGIAVYTDEAHWREEVPSQFPFAYTKEGGLHRVPYDIIKLKAHKSAELIKQRSLLLKILALSSRSLEQGRVRPAREAIGWPVIS